MNIVPAAIQQATFTIISAATSRTARPNIVKRILVVNGGLLIRAMATCCCNMLMSTTTAVLSAADDALASYSSLIATLRTSHKDYRQRLNRLGSSDNDEIRQLPYLPSNPSSPVSSPLGLPNSFSPTSENKRNDLPPSKRARVERYTNYVPEEETIRNDYSQEYVNSGNWPQNWVIGAELGRRFEE